MPILTGAKKLISNYGNTMKTSKHVILILALIFVAHTTITAAEWHNKKNGQRTYPLGVLGGVAIVHLGKPDFEVKSLISGEAGQKGGLKVGDRIIAANGNAFEEYDNDIYKAVAKVALKGWETH